MFLVRYLNQFFVSRPLYTPPICSEGLEAQQPLSAETDKTTTVPIIPQDIIYEIVDHLDTDPYSSHTLRSCSLISKSWVAPCRRHLFHAVSFRLKDTFKWIEVFPVPEQSPAHYVKHLSLSLEGNYYPPHEFLQNIQLFTSVKEMVMLGDGGPGESWWIPSFERLPESVTSLTITKDKVALLEIWHVINQLPNLDNLTLSVALPTVDKKNLRGIGTFLKGRFGGRLWLHGIYNSTCVGIANMLLEVPTGLYFTEMDLRGTDRSLLSTVRLVEACHKTLVRLSYMIDEYGKSCSVPSSNRTFHAK